MPEPGFEHGSKRFFKELIEGFIVVFILWNIIGGIFPLARLLAVIFVLACITNIAQKAKYWNTLYMLGFLFAGILIAILCPQLISLDTVIILAVVVCYLINRFV